jgi:hypothetical protein
VPSNFTVQLQEDETVWHACWCCPPSFDCGANTILNRSIRYQNMTKVFANA